MIKFVATDIDGCLSEYPKHFLNWVEKYEGNKFIDILDLKNSRSEEEYEILKNTYRNSGIKRTLPLLDQAQKTLTEISRQGYKLCVVTTRPKTEPVYTDTEYWLNNNDIPYDELQFTNNKVSYFLEKGIDNFEIIIDDDYEVIKRIASLSSNTKAIYFNKNIEEGYSNNIYTVNNWLSIKKILK